MPEDAANDRLPPKAPAQGRDTGGSPEEDIPPWFWNHLYAGRPLPPELHAVVQDVIGPLYRQMVLEERDPPCARPATPSSSRPQSNFCSSPPSSRLPKGRWRTRATSMTPTLTHLMRI